MLIKRFNIVVILFMSLFLFSCIEEYEPSLDNYEELLVIDGRITNEPGPYTVRLSTSRKVYNDGIIPSPGPGLGAEVIISDNKGNAETLSALGFSGIYTTSPSGIRGVPGREYKITIQTQSGKTYESEYELLHQPTPIDSVYAELEYRLDKDYDYELGGYQFYLDAYPSDEGAKHFLWNLEATYQYQSDFFIDYVFDGNLSSFPSNELYNCWTTHDINKIFTFNLENLATPKISKLPLHYVNTKTRQLSVRYSLLVKQYAISPEAFLFWDRLKNQEEQQGALYSSQPFQVRGNLKNIDNPEEPVLGYFMTAGVSRKRIFVDRPPLSVPFQYAKCFIVETDYYAFEEIELSSPSTWPLYVTIGPEGARALPNQACLDCRLRGGTVEKPGFWID